jgi:hypothetical protein
VTKKLRQKWDAQTERSKHFYADVIPPLILFLPFSGLFLLGRIGTTGYILGNAIIVTGWLPCRWWIEHKYPSLFR